MRRTAHSARTARLTLAAWLGSLCPLLSAAHSPAAADEAHTAGSEPVAVDEPLRLARERRASEVVDSLSFAGARIQRSLRLARSQGGAPTARERCLDELLTRVHVAERASRSTRDAVTAALDRGDLRRADIELARLAALQDRGRRLVAKEPGCGLRPATSTESGATRVRVIQPPLPAPEDLPRLDGSPPPAP